MKFTSAIEKSLILFIAIVFMCNSAHAAKVSGNGEVLEASAKLEENKKNPLKKPAELKKVTLDQYKQQLKTFGLSEKTQSDLIRVFKNDPTLKELKLVNNQIGDKGAALIADALKKNTTLKKLYLGKNKIGDEGAALIADALKKNTTLTALGLYGNQIGDEGASALADALKKNTTLTSLGLYDNQIGDKGAGFLAEALKQNSSLTGLYFGYNKIGEDLLNQIKDKLEENKTNPRKKLQNPKNRGNRTKHSL